MPFLVLCCLGDVLNRSIVKYQKVNILYPNFLKYKTLHKISLVWNIGIRFDLLCSDCSPIHLVKGVHLILVH